MLTLMLPKAEFFDERTQEFVEVEALTLHLEHSLVSLSKWEAKHQKPFLTDAEKTPSEMLDYIHCMVVDDIELSEGDLLRIRRDQAEQITSYMNEKMTATWFSEQKGVPSRRNREQITAELIYYWMISAQIPIECETWHLNRLFTLLRVFAEKNKDPKKNRMPRRQALNQQHLLNEQRKQQLGTRG